MNTKLLYIMGIDWLWAYQRPQILAELMAADYDVTVVFPRSILARGKGCPVASKLRFRILWTLPFQEKNGFVRKLSNSLNRRVFRDIKSFDIIYIGYPLYVRYIPSELHDRVFYDCMDNYDYLYPDPQRVSQVKEAEEKLVRSCNSVFVSSIALKKKIDSISKKNTGILVRNAAMSDAMLSPKKPERKKQYLLAYVGTISSWFDETAIIDSLCDNDSIKYLFIGPAKKKIDHPQITYPGQVGHSALVDHVKNADCLIMPFVVNEVVEYVDPVKLYEYIAFGKCIVSVYYDEISRFEDYVYFYRTSDDYCQLIEDLASRGFPPKYDIEQQKDFISENTWEKRYQVVKKALNNSRALRHGRR